MPPPRTRPQPRRPGAFVEPIPNTWRAEAYRWTCPCGCTRNLRGLLQETCVHCRHVHPDPAHDKEPTP